MSAEAISGQRVTLIYNGHSPIGSDGEITSMKQTLCSLGYDVIKVEFKARLREFVDLLEFNRPDIAVNLCRTHPAFPRLDMAIAGVLDLLGIPYPGPDPSALSLAQDLRRALGYLAAHSVPLCQQTSSSEDQVTIALLGNGSPRILSSENGSTSAEMKEIALNAYSLLGLRDYALFHFSAGGNCTPKLSGFSCTPDLYPHSCFAQCAEASGLPYPALIDEILTYALHRARR